MHAYAQRLRTSALVTLGDNDYTRSAPAFARNWQESFGWTSHARVRVIGALGNHDVELDGGRYQFATLGMPSRYYSRRVGNAAVFVLDSNDVAATQTAWLRRALARSRARWRIAVLHHPPYTCGTYRSAEAVVRAWVPLFERHRVRLVLSGHDHNYQRFSGRNRVTYVVRGGGGANIYALADCPQGYPRRVAGRSEHGFLSIRVGTNRLEVVAVDLMGRAVDRVVLRRPR